MKRKSSEIEKLNINKEQNKLDDVQEEKNVKKVKFNNNSTNQLEHYANNFTNTIKDYILQNRLTDLVQLAKNNQNNLKYKEYTKLKFKNHIYQLNDTVLLLNDDEQQKELICKINKIIRIEDTEKVLPLIEVQLFYQKNELHQKFNKYQGIFSDYEVFMTNHYEITFVDCINGTCQILKYEDYDQLQQIDPDIYFSRASYDRITKQIQPPITKWQKACICQKPLNPDLQYICCDSCTIWLHLTCIGLTQEEADKIEKYICRDCKIQLNKINK